MTVNVPKWLDEFLRDKQPDSGACPGLNDFPEQATGPGHAPVSSGQLAFPENACRWIGTGHAPQFNLRVFVLSGHLAKKLEDCGVLRSGSGDSSWFKASEVIEESLLEYLMDFNEKRAESSSPGHGVSSAGGSVGDENGQKPGSTGSPVKSVRPLRGI